MLYLFFLLFGTSFATLQLPGNGSDVTECVLQKWYNGTVANGKENIYHFNVSKVATVRIKAVRKNTSVNNFTPLVFVARLYGGVSAWTVPLSVGDPTSKQLPYNTVSQTLCPALNSHEITQNFYLDVSSASRQEIAYSFKAITETDFVLSLDKEQRIKVNPAEPTFFTYKFVGDEERVLVKAISDSSICAVLMVQNSKCPSAVPNKDAESSVYATMTTQAAITVERSRIEDGSFYVVVAVKESDSDCEYQSGRINPFAPTNTDVDDDDDVSSDRQFGNAEPQREKHVTVKIEKLPKISDYIGPVVFPLIFFGMFYVIAFIILVVSWCMAEDGGKSFYAYLFPSKVKDPTNADSAGGGSYSDECDHLLTTPPQSTSYGANVSAELPIITSAPDQIDNVIQRSESHDSDLMDGYDYLEDVDHIKDMYRLKEKGTSQDIDVKIPATLFISDVSKKPYKKLSKKFNVYYWNLLTISVFYALPVIQLVLTYQRVVNTSGDQDICYYNFFCARPYHLVSAFNNIYSNIGYMMLGLLFIFLVMRRDRLSRQLYAKDPEREKRFGIPRHYGVMYAMGFALFMEGLMSSCYHVCPNYSNFQFDTAFMYMIGLLGCLRLYQTRHHDVFLNGHFAFTGFAAVIFTSVIGVIFRSTTFWIIFLLLHVSVCFYLSCQVYYMGRVRTAFKIHWLATQRRFWCSAPIYKIRFILLLIFNIVNWSLSINGLVNIPKDFATYLLGIIIANGLLYCVFYVIMKIKNGECIKFLPLASMILSCITWGVSISFFIKGLTDWQTSPAQSREGNRDCKLFKFYDDHDLWHYLSAMALFFSFIAVLTLDDDLDDKERTSIVVF